jgi:hypothetical protein
MDNSQVDEFLRNIGQIESAGGKNTNHPVIKSGIQKGDSAIGTYGLMPNTVDEIASKSKDPAINSLTDMSSAEKKDYIEKNPAVEKILATQLAEKVLANQGGDAQKAAYAWNQGHNLSPDSIVKRDYQNSDYVQKYNKAAGQQPDESSFPKIRGLAGSTAPTLPSPLSIEGTPSADIVRSSLGDTRDVGSDQLSPDENTVRDLYQRQAMDLSSSIAPKVSPVMVKEPEPAPLPKAPYPEFTKLQNYISPKVLPTPNILLRQPPDIMSVVNKIKKGPNG